jgi:hypothetical protein|nr:MAG TPA: hypothetical protein [Caudoviricetes sp.]
MSPYDIILFILWLVFIILQAVTGVRVAEMKGYDKFWQKLLAFLCAPYSIIFIVLFLKDKKHVDNE